MKLAPEGSYHLRGYHSWSVQGDASTFGVGVGKQEPLPLLCDWPGGPDGTRLCCCRKVSDFLNRACQGESSQEEQAGGHQLTFPFEILEECFCACGRTPTAGLSGKQMLAL